MHASPASTPSGPRACVFNLSETLQWEQVGKLESELKVYDMVSIGDGKQQIVFPSGEEKLLEVLGEQVRKKTKKSPSISAECKEQTNKKL